MRAILLTAVATASVLLSGVAMEQADAFIAPLCTAATFHTKTIANVCGSNGCARVQTQRVVKHQKAGNVVPSRN